MQKKCKVYCATSINNFNSILNCIMQTETENSATRKGRGMTTFRSLIIAYEALNYTPSNPQQKAENGGRSNVAVLGETKLILHSQ